MRGDARDISIFGAGLSGLTAAIILAGRGREVTVFEKENRVGGSPVLSPAPHGTPMDADRMRDYLGFDLRPGMVPLKEMVVSLWGKRYQRDFSPSAPCWMIERGPRSSSMDSYLADLARERGARIETGRPLASPVELEELKERSRVILATGNNAAGYEAAGVPRVRLYSWLAKCRVPWEEARVSVYFDDYTPDYAFTCSVNGVGFALIFNRERPVEVREREKFARQAVEEDGYPLRRFTSYDGMMAPVASFRNPRLFSGEMILAGTLAGMIDPVLFFGMHGAFVSGRVAADAVDDPRAALREFRRLNATFKPALAAKRMAGLLPGGLFVKYPARMAMRLWPLYSGWLPRLLYAAAVTGYNRI